ncbi:MULTISPECIES: DUF1887 family protein [Sphaerospermopsis]|jgi:hypothetical protein|uniref:DUF1887 family protein n=1 Tax=Sphaerospermopsis torques-reginae ITEP-024 TaxID=984208 RepID=A0ABX8X085_9CYAN|nr:MULTISPECIES: DUF1887 family protein [Sphaerospermopsis]MBE9055267.1 DUF1887 family protein [Sphaerospermopsis sp. LEGE 08334]QYX32115.1 DUF1887 family protein [Sphaerospermopsis torques-reginae ITEP-024]
MVRVLISLLGGRPVPNILTALHIKPDYIYMIVSKDSLSSGGSYDKAISALPKNLQPSEPLAVRPYVLQDTIERCQEIAKNHSNDEIIINSASEPKTMTFGAYDFAKALNADGKKVDICYLSREGFIWAFRNTDKIESAKIGLQEYFASYGWDIRLKTLSDNYKFRNLVSLLTENMPNLHSKAEQLGKGMCSTLLVSSVSKNKRTEKDLQEFERWARERQIVLVMAEDIPRMSDILKKIVTGDKELEPKNIPCYARI